LIYSTHDIGIKKNDERHGIEGKAEREEDDPPVLDEKGIRTNKGQALTLSLSSVLHPPIRCSLVFFLPFVEAAAAQGMKH
jgi:hypothetical protein